MVDSPSRVEFALFEVPHSKSLSVTIAPFVWDYCQIFIPNGPKRFSFDPIKAWFLRWFDPNDENAADGAGLFGVVHFLSDPQQKEDGVSFAIDFGSAPIEAFEQLLVAIDETGAANAHVS